MAKAKGKDTVDKSWITKAKALTQELCLVGLSRSQPGMKVSFHEDETRRMAKEFEASTDVVSGKKKIFDTKRKSYRDVTKVLAQAKTAWTNATFPWTEPGYRMIRKTEIVPLSERLDKLSEKLYEAVEALGADLPEMKKAAQKKLAELYDDRDYPTAVELLDAFKIEYQFADMGAAEFLREISPALAEAEEMRIASQVSIAIAETEADFYEELAKTVGHLMDRLQTTDGKQKVIQARNVSAFSELFTRFENMNLPGERMANLKSLMGKAKDAIKDVSPDNLKGQGSGPAREALKAAMRIVQDAITENVVERPKRKYRLSAGGGDEE